ncbi:MAG TPA: flagellin [Capsulimonadaceae bacterium]|jgi:flagellin
MSTRIATNTTAFMASHNLNKNSDAQSTDIQRLSTGLRINSAADDAAGLVISQNMNAQIVGLNQATSNTNDAINMTKTAESALNEVHSLLMSMRQLAVHASNSGVNDSTATAADQAQIASAIQSINRISATTQFGTKKLLDGSANSGTTIGASTASVGGSGMTLKSAGTWTSLNAGNYGGATVAAATASSYTVTSASSLVNGQYSGSMVINGTTYNLPSGSNGINALNTAIKASGYQASEGAAGLVFTQQVAGAPTTAQTFDITGLTALDASSAADALTPPAGVVAGTDAQVTLTGGGALSNYSSTSSVDNGDGTATYSFDNGLVVVASNVTGAVTGSGGAASLTSAAGTATKGTDLYFQIGANEGQTASLSIRSTSADQLGRNSPSYNDASGASQTVYTGSIADIDVTSFKGAQDAIAVIDKAISDISTVRADLGAFQVNILQSNANSLNVASQNLSASKSSITDADLAATVVAYTKDQILVQSATSALSYANQQPQSVLKLLQG